VIVPAPVIVGVHASVCRRPTGTGSERGELAVPERLTLQGVEIRPVLVPLRRPVVSRVGLYEQWPLILIDLYTEQGVVGRSYLAPYLKAGGALHRPGDRGSRGRAARPADRAAGRLRRRAEGARPGRPSKG
jgi:hypothetical protein